MSYPPMTEPQTGYPTPVRRSGPLRKVLVGASVAVGGFVVLAVAGALLTGTKTSGDKLTTDTATSIPGVVNGVPAAQTGNWPAQFAPFTALIGTGPAAGDAWNSAQCAATSLGATGELHTVTCLEPDDTSVFLTSFADQSDVTSLIVSDVHSGGTAPTPNVAGRQGLASVVTNTANGDTTVANTFDRYPSILLTMQGANPATVQADWQSAPLPG